MRYAIEYYYTDGKRKIDLAIFIFDGERISYELKYSGEPIKSPSFNPARLKEHLRSIIHLPIMRADLRARTMPGYFEPLRPNSIEHFRSIRHNTTYFKFSPIRQVCA